MKQIDTNTVAQIEAKTSLARKVGKKNPFLDKLKVLIDKQIEGLNSGDENDITGQGGSNPGRPSSRLQARDLDAKIMHVITELDIVNKMETIKDLKTTFDDLSVQFHKQIGLIDK